MHRRLPVIVLGALALGCFDDPPDVSEDSGGPACEMGEVSLPPVPEGSSAWALIAVGSPAEPPAECPPGTIASVVFADVDESASCGCVCEPDVCVPHYSTGQSCGGELVMHDQLVGCDVVGDEASSIDVSTNPGPDAQTCPATGVPIPGPSAIPFTVCELPGAGDSCVPRPEGFLGPCIAPVAAACPEGFEEVAAEATELSCDGCTPCNSAQFCDTLSFTLFPDELCEGAPVGMVGGPEGCVVTDPFVAVRVGRIDPQANACALVPAMTQTARICCLP